MIGPEQMARVGVKQLCPHDDFHRRAAKERLVDIKAGAVIQIPHHHQRIARLQMVLHPPPKPDRLRQLLAAVGNGDRAGFFRGACAMGGLGFQMRADQAKGHAIRRGHHKLHRGFGKPHHIGLGIHIEVDFKRRIEPGRAGR